jgi:cadmium resistance protein CadD (predicted permease)
MKGVSEVLIIAGVAIAAFVSTNLDNLFLLMGMLGGSRTHTRDVAFGYGLSMSLVLAVGLAGSYAADWTAQGWLRYLGLIPLAMGLWRLRALLPGNAHEVEATVARTGALPVFSTMLANSGDSLGVFTALMSETAEPLVPVIIATVLAMVCVWAFAARWVVAHPAFGPHLRRLDRFLVPALLIALGLYILTDTATDTI